MNLEPVGILDDIVEMIEVAKSGDEDKLKEASFRHIRNWADGIIVLFSCLDLKNKLSL